MYFEQLIDAYCKLPEVAAIALGGSRAGKNYDEKSDYDLYVYVRSMPDEGVRRNILAENCSYTEIGNSFWETEDDCTLKDGIDIDILYRSMEGFEEGIRRVVTDCNAGTGYTTCMWHNLLNSKILYDPDGKYAQLQNRYRVAYPEELRKNIITKNMKLLGGMLPSYDGQITKALERGDLPAINHRVAAYLESYFEVIFAVNRMTHPGEKRQVQMACQNAKYLPLRFEENIDRLFKVLFKDPDAVIGIIGDMNQQIGKLVETIDN